MRLLHKWLGWTTKARQAKTLGSRSGRLTVEALEARELLTASPLPVLLVVADQRDFFYKEYADTRLSLENEGVGVVVAATTTQPTTPHPGSGQPWWTDGTIIPDITLAAVDPADYSAIAFVGGWGSSMYQYAFPYQGGVVGAPVVNDYQDDLYDGDPAVKEHVNTLINEFLAADKYVAAVCNAVLILAWARIDGVSPLEGRQVAVPFIGTPEMNWEGVHYGPLYSQGAYLHVVANGGIANPVSGQHGPDPISDLDDVVVDDHIITAENQNTALAFGEELAQRVIAAANVVPPNQAPTIAASGWMLAENSTAGTLVGLVNASDPDVGQTLTYAITAGNTNNAFAIDPATGAVTVANAAALDFETAPVFNLTVTVTDNDADPLQNAAVVTVQLLDRAETPVQHSGPDVLVQGTPAADTIYLWSSGAQGNQVFAWINGAQFGPFLLPAGGRVIAYGNAGNDQIYATDLRVPAFLYGEDGHDLMTGGSADDLLDGGEGVDRLWGGPGDDLIRGGNGDDQLHGREGNDILLGGAGNDWLDGFDGRDILIGGLGSDNVRGGDGEDLLIGGSTSYDNDAAALSALRTAWTAPAAFRTRLNLLAGGSANGVRLQWGETVQDDGLSDALLGGGGADWLFAQLGDVFQIGDPEEILTLG